MKNSIALFTATLCLFFSACHRPVAYFQRTPHPVAARLSAEQASIPAEIVSLDSISAEHEQLAFVPEMVNPVVSLKKESGQSTVTRVERRIQRIQSLLSTRNETTDRQPDPKPKKKLKLGNQIRQSLGMRLRPELNWWQRISWKLKASVLVILVAVLFAVLHITILAVIFGILGAFLLITGLKRSFKVRRPWF